jgi:serine/threonine protein kinase/Tfp pilus assembly protein PilF
MSPTTLGKTWELATSPAVARITSRFESAWQEQPGRPPEPRAFLPDDPENQSGVLLAILRIDMAERRRARLIATLEWYREQYPELGDEGLIALIYEEFCLREEEGARPDPFEYEQRFPALAAAIRDVLDIHDLVGSAGSSSLLPLGGRDIVFPAAGHTMAGFRLVEEIGRGTFSRVYRALDRSLAERPVALKVTSAGSREPQTLARLQHTHIVPVYSQGTDPASGLQFLCMPYYGRLTLATLLADPAISRAGTGAELVAAIERLRGEDSTSVLAARRALAGRSYARAIAWWGARLAEALEHAHERGVLHRDIKPSNVLITGDGLPMLLDFNLAHEPQLRGVGQDRLGGTLAYMSPEQMESIAEGRAGGVDHRGDIYSLGVVLHEALGSRPFAPLCPGGSATASLLNAALQRKLGAPRIRDTHPDVPPELDAVLQACLAPDPADRYPSAAALASDLDAVASDLPLRYAREPIPSACARLIRRNKRRLAVASLAALALILAGGMVVSRRADRARITRDASRWIERADASAALGRHALASSQFGAALALIHDRSDFRDLAGRARAGQRLADQTQRATAEADDSLSRLDGLKFALLELRDPAATSREAQQLFDRLGVWSSRDWRDSPNLTPVDAARRERLRGDVNDVMFLWAKQSYVRDNAEAMRRGAEVCDLALRFAEPKGPWRELKARFVSAESPRQPNAADHGERASARACFQRGLLAVLDADEAAALSWFASAVDNDPRDFWARMAYAIHLSRARKPDLAVEQYGAAIVLRQDAPWAYFNRGQILWAKRADFAEARADLERAATLGGARGFPEAQLELGALLQATGDVGGARARFQEVLAQETNPAAQWAARINLARLAADQGSADTAYNAYSNLLTERPSDRTALWGRALLTMRLGRSGEAINDLTRLLADTVSPSDRSRILADRALAKLATGDFKSALLDAETAHQLDPAPARRALWNRVLLAAGEPADLRDLYPEAILAMPRGGMILERDLTRALEGLEAKADDGPDELRRARSRALILSAVGRHAAALDEANRALDLAPLAAASYLVRCRVRIHAGDANGAMADADYGLTIEPGDPELIAMRGRVFARRQEWSSAVAQFSKAIDRGAGHEVFAWRAAAQHAVGNPKSAITDWTQALERDPESAEFYLGRARALGALGQWENAFADLEHVVGRVNARSQSFWRALGLYAYSLSQRPDRLERVLGLMRRGWRDLRIGLKPDAQGPVRPVRTTH